MRRLFVPIGLLFLVASGCGGGDDGGGSFASCDTCDLGAIEDSFDGCFEECAPDCTGLSDSECDELEDECRDSCDGCGDGLQCNVCATDCDANALARCTPPRIRVVGPGLANEEVVGQGTDGLIECEGGLY